jgi:iron complex outermembrane receptor protein
MSQNLKIKGSSLVMSSFYSALGISFILTSPTSAQEFSQTKIENQSEVQNAFQMENSVVNSDRDFNQNLSQTLADQPSSSIDELMKTLPGASLTRRGAFGGDLVLRGQNNARVKMQIDGMSLHGACTDRMDPISIYAEPSNLAGFDQDLGSNALESGGSGGSLNFQLARAHTALSSHRVWSLKSGISSAERSTMSAIALDERHHNWGLHNSISFRKALDYVDAKGQIVDYSAYQKINASSSFLWTINPLWDLQVKTLIDRGDNLGYPALSMDAGYALAQLYSTSLNYHSEHLDAEFKAFVNTVDHDMDDTKRDSVAMHMDMPGTSKTMGFIALASGCGDHSVWKTVLEIDNNERFASMTMYYPNESNMYLETWPELSRSRIAFTLTPALFFGDLKFKTTQRFEFNFNQMKNELGKNQFSIFYQNPLSKRKDFAYNSGINATYTPSFGEISFQSAYGERLPDLPEIWGYYLFDARSFYDQIGNPNIKKERFIHLESNLKIQTDEHDLSLSFWSKAYDDYINPIVQNEFDAMTPGAKGIRTWQNTGRAYLMGQEAKWNMQFSEVWEWQNRAQWVWGELENGDPLSQIDAPNGVTALRYKASNWSAILEVESALAQNRVSALDQEQRTPAWTTLNFKSSKDFKHSRAKSHWTLGLSNLLNTAYRSHLDWGKFLRPGFGVNLGVGVDF